jgi:sigma54-dependent transcription regulator
MDCGAIPDELAASEFFGHVKGAFTGAVTDKTGAFEAANGGTLFLDEIGNLSYNVQVQLLRALQERRIRKIGTNKETQVDVRIVCATNENLLEAIQEGRFGKTCIIGSMNLHCVCLHFMKDVRMYCYLQTFFLIWQTGNLVVLSRGFLLKQIRHYWLIPGLEICANLKMS